MSPSPHSLYVGSAATVQRYRGGLLRRGHLCEVFGGTSEGNLKQSLAGTIERFGPDIVHAHDAALSGLDLLGLRSRWVVSISGEDMYERMMQGTNGAAICEVFRRANRVLVPSVEAGATLEDRVPECIANVDVVPRAAVELSTSGTDLRRSLGIPRQRFVILLPGGIRPVKGQHRALGLVRKLRANGADAEMIIVGPKQDEAYVASLEAAIADEPGVRILPALSADRMGAAYRDADVVLNTSTSEGMSPTILEAGMLGCAIVASDSPGNRDVVRHNETGLLFEDEESLAKCVLALCRNRSAAGSLGVRVREDFKRRFRPDVEIDALLSAYAAA